MKDVQPKQRSLDQSIDDFIEGLIDFVTRNFRRLVVVAALFILFWIYALPIWGLWLPFVASGVGMLLQMAFAVMFMIIQFVALFWFLGKGRTYWVKPGETGVGFKDYKGNPEVLESARRIVTLLRGAKDFKAMGGEAVRGLLLVGPPGTGKSYLAQVISTEAGVPFGYASAPSFQNMFMGIGNLRVMML
jgi:cell division protease FtsH